MFGRVHALLFMLWKQSTLRVIEKLGVSLAEYFVLGEIHHRIPLPAYRFARFIAGYGSLEFVTEQPYQVVIYL